MTDFSIFSFWRGRGTHGAATGNNFKFKIIVGAGASFKPGEILHNQL